MASYVGRKRRDQQRKKDQKGKRVRVGGYDYPQTENLKGSRRRSSDLQTASQKSMYLWENLLNNDWDTLSRTCPGEPTVTLNHSPYCNSCAVTFRINKDAFSNMQFLPYLKPSDLISDLLLITHKCYNSGITMPCCEVASLSLCSHWALSWLNLSSSSSFSLPQFRSPICSWLWEINIRRWCTNFLMLTVWELGFAPTRYDIYRTCYLLS